MNEIIEKRVSLASLTKKEKLALDFIMKNINKACFMSSNDIGRELGIGASSVVRLSGKLGYANFSAMKKDLQEGLLQSAFHERVDVVPYEKLACTHSATDRDLLTAYTQNVLNHIGTDSASDTEERLSAAVDEILAAERVFIAGFRACSGLAATFTTMLTCCRSGVATIGQQQPLVDQLIGLTGRDLLIAISFHRYSRDAYFAAQMAHDAGSEIVVMTDSYAAPLAEFADIVVINSVENFTFFNTYTSFVTNMEKIVMLTGHRNIPSTLARLEKMESYLGKTNQY